MVMASREGGSQMTSRSVQRSTGFTLMLFLLTVLIVPSLMTYHASDISVDIWPHANPTQNIWGGLGANIADQLFRGLGYGVWFLALSLAVTTMSALMGYPVTAPVLRLIGWLIALTGVCTLCSVYSLQLAHSVDTPMIGPGGFLGVTTHAILLHYVTPTGTLLVAVSMVLGGTIVCTDLPFVLLRGVIFLLTGHRIHSPGFMSETAAFPVSMDIRLPTTSSTTVAVPINPISSASAASPTSAVPSKMSILTNPFSNQVTSEGRRVLTERPPRDAVPLAETASSKGPLSAQNIGEIPIRSAAKPIAEQVSGDRSSTSENMIGENHANIALQPSKTPSDANLKSDVPQRPGLLERLLSGLKKQPSESGVSGQPAGQSVTTNPSRSHPSPGAQAARLPVNFAQHGSPHDETELIPVDQNRYQLPSIELLSRGKPLDFDRLEQENRLRARLLEKTFADFGFHVRVVEIQVGPVIAMFEIELERGLRLNRIMSLGDDLAVKLRVPSVRIVAPIPGKNTVGIEVPNATREIVRLRELMEQSVMQTSGMELPLFIGKDVAGEPMSIDLAKLPHLLIAGTTGTGKSVCLNAIIISLLMTRSPDEVRMILIDPKMVELSGYQLIPHLMHPPVTDMHKAEAILGWAVEKMEQRYQLLAKLHVRNIKGYNVLGEREISRRLGRVSEEEREKYPAHMPYFVLVADEMADLMMTAPKEVESHIIRLAQKSRAVGIHLVLATQKPTVNIITGLIKSNMPARICFKVFSLTDSRVILDQQGGEKLLGQGDMLYMGPTTGTLLRGQGTFLSDEEINRVIEEIAVDEPEYVEELENLQTEETQKSEKPVDRDERYFETVDFVVREGKASTSLLQRALGLGYGRAARIIDHMFEDGIVGPSSPTKGREILITSLQWDRMKASWNGEEALPDFEDESNDSSLSTVFTPTNTLSQPELASVQTVATQVVAAQTVASIRSPMVSPPSPAAQSTLSPTNTQGNSAASPHSTTPVMESLFASVPPRRSTRIILAPPTPDPQFDPLAEHENLEQPHTDSFVAASAVERLKPASSAASTTVMPRKEHPSTTVTPTTVESSTKSVSLASASIVKPSQQADSTISEVVTVPPSDQKPASSAISDEQEEDSDDDFNWYDNVAKEITLSDGSSLQPPVPSQHSVIESAAQIDSAPWDHPTKMEDSEDMEESSASETMNLHSNGEKIAVKNYTDEQLECILRPAEDTDTTALGTSETTRPEDSSPWDIDAMAQHDEEDEYEGDDWDEDTEISDAHGNEPEPSVDPFSSNVSPSSLSNSDEFHSVSGTNPRFRKKKKHKKKRRH